MKKKKKKKKKKKAAKTKEIRNLRSKPLNVKSARRVKGGFIAVNLEKVMMTNVPLSGHSDGSPKK